MAALIWTWEKSTVQSVGAKRRKPASNRKEKSISEKGTVHDILQLMRYRATKTTWRGEEHHWEILQRVCSLRSTVFTTEFGQTLACVVSKSFVITHLLTSACSCMSISWARAWKLCLSPPTSLTSCLVTYLVPRPQEMSCWAKIQLKIIARVSHFPVLHS